MTPEEAKTRKLLAQYKQECERAKMESVKNGEDEDDSGWCEVVWDNILCWNRTRAGTVVKLQCPAYITRFTTSEFAERVCTEDGTWWFSQEHNSSWTNFSKCVIPPLDISSHTTQANNLVLLYTIGYSVSLVSLIVAITIILYWRSVIAFEFRLMLMSRRDVKDRVLWKDIIDDLDVEPKDECVFTEFNIEKLKGLDDERLHRKSTTLHINLFIAFILRASLSFMKDRLFVCGLGLPDDVRQGQAGLDFIQEGMHWECRTLFVLLMFAISASQTWMLMEGLYLYLLVHKTMATERLGIIPYVILGWALPWTFLVPWIVVKFIFENTYCWNMQENPAFFWILKGPWTAIVVINFFFFLDIIRALTTRVRNNQRHAGRSQYRKVGKFILVLIPLFGVMYIVLTVAFPSEVQGLEYNVVYMYIEMGYNSFQGFILALLFCFLNEDVHSEIRRSWLRHRSRRYTSSILRRSTTQNLSPKSSRLSGITLTTSNKKFTSSGKNRITTNETKTFKLLNLHSKSST